MEVVARDACRQVGLPEEHLRFLRLGQNILFHVPHASVVVRIARDASYRADAVKEVAVATWLAGEGLPAARIFDVGREQPMCIAGHPVTFWCYLPGRTATGDEVAVTGGLLRRLHNLPVPEALQLPPFRPLDRVDRRLRAAPIPVQDKEFLASEKSRLESALENVTYVLPFGVNHGDAHIKNVIVAPDRSATLIDFEAANVAHHEWDLAKTATEAEMGMLPENAYDRFSAAYGYDITDWDGFPTIRSAMQLRMITWLAQNVGHTETITSEYRKRISTLRYGLTERWRGY